MKSDTKCKPPGSERIFVYGTLRRDGSNAHRLRDGHFVAPASVRGRLYRISWYPGIVLDPHGDPIHGELWDIPAAIMPELDAFEGPEYRRLQTAVAMHSDPPQTTNAWLWEWLHPTDHLTRIPHGDWLAVDDSD